MKPRETTLARHAVIYNEYLSKMKSPQKFGNAMDIFRQIANGKYHTYSVIRIISIVQKNRDYKAKILEMIRIMKYDQNEDFFRE